jgi:hypothetical protein
MGPPRRALAAASEPEDFTGTDPNHNRRKPRIAAGPPNSLAAVGLRMRQGEGSKAGRAFFGPLPSTVKGPKRGEGDRGQRTPSKNVCKAPCSPSQARRYPSTSTLVRRFTGRLSAGNHDLGSAPPRSSSRACRFRQEALVWTRFGLTNHAQRAVNVRALERQG